jgi:MFS family permease
LPEYYGDLKVEEIRAKATGSLASVGAFLGFTVAVLAGLLALNEFRQLFVFAQLKDGETLLCKVIVGVAGTFCLTYWTFWQERYISAGSVKGEIDEIQRRRRKRSVVLIVLLLATLYLLLGLPRGFHGSKELLTKELFRHAFPLAGAAMIIVAIIASNSYMLGVSLALTALALNVCVLNLYVGCFIAVVSLVVLVIMTEVERQVWDFDKEPKRIRCRAYEIYENHGREQGRALDNWLEAETEIRQQKKEGKHGQADRT